MIFEARRAIAAVDHGDSLRELGEEQCFFHRGVTAADHGDVLILEEETVAGCAPADAVAGEALLVGQPELTVGRARSTE